MQSDSTYVPLKADQISGTESDDSSIRSVRFSKLAEVREMSPNEATEALLSRLSYAASLRVRSQKTHNKTARTALMFCILVNKIFLFNSQAGTIACPVISSIGNISIYFIEPIFLSCFITFRFGQWFIANYLFQLALEPNEAALVTLLSSTSSFFTLILAALYPSSNGDKLTLSKIFAVILSIGGVVSIPITALNTERGVITSHKPININQNLLTFWFVLDYGHDR